MRASFEHVYAVHHRRAFRLAYLLTGDRHEAADVTADAFARVFARWSDDIEDAGADVTRAGVGQVRSLARHGPPADPVGRRARSIGLATRAFVMQAREGHTA